MRRMCILCFFSFFLFYQSLIGKILIVSDRDQFYDPDNLSQSQVKKEVIFEVPLKIKAIDRKSWIDSINEKKIVLIIHGYNNTSNEAFEFFLRIFQRIESLYEGYICYLWPGNDDFLEYLSAKSYAIGKELPKRLQNLMQNLTLHSNQVDIIAYSMGCRLILETLKAPSQLKVGNVFLLAPAIDNESLEKSEHYSSAIDKCRNIVVFFSKNDKVLNYLYPFVEGDFSLGAKGSENPHLLPPNIHMVNSSPYIKNHQDYSQSEFIFKIIGMVQ